MSMFGNSRNGRAVKLALVVGLFLVVLYFLISWRVEAQSLTQNLADVEGEYQALMKRYHGLERELKDMSDLKANCEKDIKLSKNQARVLQSEKVDLQEQLEAVKADRDTKSQEAQRFKDELHEAKDAADDEYQALSASCVQNQQTCERRARQAEEDLTTLKAESLKTQQALQSCQDQLTVQQELAGSCNVRVLALEKEGANNLREIEQLQDQVHRAEREKANLVADAHKQQNAQWAGHQPGQPDVQVNEELQQFQKRYGGVNIPGDGRRDDVLRGHRNQRIGFNDFAHGNRGEGINDGVRDQRQEFREDNFGVRDHHGQQLRETNVGDRDRNQQVVRERKDANFGVRYQKEDLHGNRVDHMSPKKAGELKDSFDDFRISDEQKRNVFDSLQGKLSRGEPLDDQQLHIFQLLSKELESDKKRVRADEKEAPVQNGMGMEHKPQEDIDDDAGKVGGAEHQQLPNPLDEGEEIKDLVEEQQKADEFDNLGGNKKVEEAVDRDQDEAAGAGGEELKQSKDGQEEEGEEQHLHEDDRAEKKSNEKNEGDKPLPRPGHDVENPDDEDDYGAKKEKPEDEEINQDDVYGDQAYKKDQELFKQERLQGQQFDRQL